MIFQKNRKKRIWIILLLLCYIQMVFPSPQKNLLLFLTKSKKISETLVSFQKRNIAEPVSATAAGGLGAKILVALGATAAEVTTCGIITVIGLGYGVYKLYGHSKKQQEKQAELRRNERKEAKAYIEEQERLEKAKRDNEAYITNLQQEKLQYLAHNPATNPSNLTNTAIAQHPVSLKDAALAALSHQESLVTLMPTPDPDDPEFKKKLEEFLKILENSQELKELEKIVKELEDKLSNNQVRTRLPNTMSVNDYLKIEKIAEELFEQIRQSTSDIAKIAQNTGISEKILQAIKNHVFLENHILDEGIRRFHANIDMADAWMRLASNNFVRSDLILLLHEYAELLIMRGQEITYKIGHSFVNNLYNWESLILK